MMAMLNPATEWRFALRGGATLAIADGHSVQPESKRYPGRWRI